MSSNWKEKVMLSGRVSINVSHALKIRSAQTGKAVQAIMEEALIDYLKMPGNEPKRAA